MSRLRRLAAAALCAIVLAACTSSGSPSATASPARSGPIPTGTASPSPAVTRSAEAELAKLCERPPAPAPSSKVPPEGPTPPAIAEVERAVERLRGLDFTQRVVPDPVTHARLAKGIARSFDQSYPKALYVRKSVAWQTIGVIPQGTSLRAALESFGTTQVIGYYDSESGELVFVGTAHPSPIERVTLAHELTHALDDQHFNLDRLDRLNATCEDERAAAALAVVEGNATYMMLQYAEKDLTPQEQLQVGLSSLEQGSGVPPGIPPFVSNIVEWSYTQGMSFVSALIARGGLEAVNDALRRFPVSTEQIIHPDKYPSDLPVPVDVPELAGALGSGWTDLDVQEVGEEWLSIALALRLPRSEAATAAAGWGGGIYRAWTDGNDVAVELATVWDTERDASEFASAMAMWIADGKRQSAEVLPVEGDSVRVLFASSGPTLTKIEGAAA